MRWFEHQRPAPVLRVRLAGGGRMMIDVGGCPLLLARVDPWQDGSVLYADADRPTRVLPAWTAADCRRLGADLDRWLWEIRRRLQASGRTPLHRGGWLLTDRPGAQWGSAAFSDAGSRVAVDLAVPEAGPDGLLVAAIDYFSRVPGRAAVLFPLRRLSTADAPRVRAHRRSVREGALAPIVALTVSGLAGHLILDGHDRLVAALVEEVEPPVVYLSRTDTERGAQAEAQAVVRYERTMAAFAEAGLIPGGDDLGATAAKRLVDELRAGDPAPTWAWPLTVAEWESAARRISPAWLADVADRCGEQPLEISQRRAFEVRSDLS